MEHPNDDRLGRPLSGPIKKDGTILSVRRIQVLAASSLVAGVLVAVGATTASAQSPGGGPPAHSNAGCVGVAIQHPDEGGGPPGSYQRVEHRDRFGQVVSAVAHRPHGCF